MVLQVVLAATRAPLFARHSCFLSRGAFTSSIRHNVNNATYPASAAATAAVAATACGPLGTADLERFIQAEGIDATLVDAAWEGSRDVAAAVGACEVKSLIFLVGQDPLVLVLPLRHRVNERRLAELLHTSRSRVRLAPTDDLVELCGYTGGSVCGGGILKSHTSWFHSTLPTHFTPPPAVGNVPPFGHSRRLPVVVDAAVAAHPSGRCCAGGGSEAAELVISLPELLRAAAATVADFSDAPGASSTRDVTSSSSGSGGGSSSGSLEDDELAAADVFGSAASLPLPWPQGAHEVSLVGMVAQTRRIAKLLLFVSLRSPPPPGSSTNSSRSSNPSTFLRRTWRHPDTQLPCEVQLILGRKWAGGGGGGTCRAVWHVRGGTGWWWARRPGGRWAL